MPGLIPGFTTPRVEYPTSDGKPMAETELHQRVMIDLIFRLKAWAATQQRVHAAGNLLVYYEEGNPQRHLAPDAFVAFRVGNHERESFKTWEEGAVPAVVFEITSKTTCREDTVTKRAVYQDVWAVDEYFLFDPREDYLDPSLQGFRRVRGAFQPIRPTRDGSLTSRRLGLTLSRDGVQLRLRDTTTGTMLLTPQDRALRAEAEKDQMAAENARLKAQIDALKKKK
jgi:Uma2 family endonuclease